MTRRVKWEQPGPLGIQLRKIDDVIVIAKASGPAETLGVQVGWHLKAVGGSPVKGSTVQYVQRMLKKAPRPVTIEFDLEDATPREAPMIVSSTVPSGGHRAKAIDELVQQYNDDSVRFIHQKYR